MGCKSKRLARNNRKLPRSHYHIVLVHGGGRGNLFIWKITVTGDYWTLVAIFLLSLYSAPDLQAVVRCGIRFVTQGTLSTDCAHTIE